MAKFEKTILVVDDEPKVVRALRSALEPLAPVVGLTDPEAALEVVRTKEVALALVDQRMSEMSGTEMLAALRTLSPETVRFLLTGYADLQSMVLAINQGQVHRYIEKPWDLERLQRDVEAGLEAYRKNVQNADRMRVLEARSLVLEEENLRLKERIETLGLDDIITANETMQRVLLTVERLAQAADPVLIYGESGTGKELVARRVHQTRHGLKAPFVALNCGAFSENLVESELFGHEKGAFTGAVSSFPGAFERADGGTLFLDEIGDLKVDLQVKLLRALEESTVRRLGGKREIPVACSVVAATHQDLNQMVSDGRFREDLYFRLSVIELNLPPLRERPEDIPLLVEHFLKQARLAYKRPALCFDREALARLRTLDLPGNVRELRNLVRRAAALARQDSVGRADLAEISPEAGRRRNGGGARRAGGASQAAEPSKYGFGSRAADWGRAVGPKNMRGLRKAREAAVADVDRAFLEHWYRRCGGNISEMSRATGLSRSHLYRMARQRGIELTGGEPDEPDSKDKKPMPD